MKRLVLRICLILFVVISSIPILSACGSNTKTILVTSCEVEMTSDFTFEQHLEFANSERVYSSLLVLNEDNSHAVALPVIYRRQINQRRQTVSDDRITLRNIIKARNDYVTMASGVLSPRNSDDFIIDETIRISRRRQSNLYTYIRVVRSAVGVETLNLLRVSPYESVSTADRVLFTTQAYPLNASFPQAQFIVQSIIRGTRTLTVGLSHYATINATTRDAILHTTGYVQTGDRINIVAVTEVDRVQSNAITITVIRRYAEYIRAEGDFEIYRGPTQVGGALNVALSLGDGLQFSVNAYPFNATANFENGFRAIVALGSANATITTINRDTFELAVNENQNLVGSIIRIDVFLRDGGYELELRIAVHIVESE